MHLGGCGSTVRSGLEGQHKGCMQEGDEQTLLPEEAELSDTNRINKLIKKAPSIMRRHQKTVNKHVIHYPSMDNGPPSPTDTGQTAEHHFKRHQNQAGHLVLTPDSIGRKTAGGPQDLQAETTRNCSPPLVSLPSCLLTSPAGTVMRGRVLVSSKSRGVGFKGNLTSGGVCHL